MLSVPINLDSIRITTEEKPSEPVVATKLLVPDTFNNWKESIEFKNLGTIAPGAETRRYEFTYSFVRATEGDTLPDKYNNLLVFYPKYTIDYQNQPGFVYEVEVINKEKV